MASSGAASLSKIQQSRNRRFAESSPKTLVGLHKADAQLKMMMDTLDHQQSTAVNNIANHQQAMKMSWRRLEERRSTSPLMSRAENKKEKAKDSKRTMLLQSNTRLYVNKTPSIYNPEGSARPVTADDSMIGRSSSMGQGIFIQNKPRVGPPPAQLNRAHTSPYISSPLSFRRSVPGSTIQNADGDGSDTQLSDSFSSSQPMLIKSSINSKEKLLKASTLMDMKSTTAGFKGFYSERPRSQSQLALATSPLVMTKQMEDMLSPEDDATEQVEDGVTSTNSLPSLAEQFEQIKDCKYIRHSRHYHADQAGKDDY